MTPERAGRLCDRLDETLRGSELNLGGVADNIVIVIRDEAWRRRRIRTGAIVECQSFLELLTAPPLQGFGEDPKKVEALLRDNAEALRLFREATTAPNHRPAKKSSDIVTTKPRRGNDRAYTLTRLQKKHPALYKRVVAGELSAHAAAIQVGLRNHKTPLDQLRHWWAKATLGDRRAFLDEVA